LYFLSGNRSSTVYNLLSHFETFRCIGGFEILECNDISDDAPLYFELLTKSMTNDETINNDNSTNARGNSYAKVDETKRPRFRSVLNDSRSRLTQLGSLVDTRHIDNVVSELTTLMNEKVSEVFTITRQPTKSGHKNIGSQPWLNTECHEAKKDFDRNRNQYCRTKSDVTRRNFVNARKNHEGKKISALAFLNPRQFWNKIEKTI